MTNAEIVEKVKKLLALSESPNEQEAATALAKAHSLLEAHNLSMGDVIYKNANEAAQPFLVAREAMPSWIEILINNVADFNYCSFLKMNTEGAPSYILVGKPINVTIASQLIDYLVQTVNRIASNSFNPRAPAGRDLTVSFEPKITAEVSIHAPLRGATV